MKKKSKVLLTICAVLMLTGCTSKSLKNAYNSMEIGSEKGQINGYSANIRLYGLYNNEKISQNARVDNYLGKNFKVSLSGNEETTYYTIDGVNYKLVANKKVTDKNLANVAEEDYLTSFSEEKYEKTDDTVPFTNTDLYLTSLKSAKNVGDASEDNIGDIKYTTYSYTVSKKDMLNILKGSSLEKVKFTKDVPAKVWIDKDGYVYKIEYDLATGVETSSILELDVYYNSINNVREISISDVRLNSDDISSSEK